MVSVNILSFYTHFLPFSYYVKYYEITQVMKQVILALALNSELEILKLFTVRESSHDMSSIFPPKKWPLSISAIKNGSPC